MADVAYGLLLAAGFKVKPSERGSECLKEELSAQMIKATQIEIKAIN